MTITICIDAGVSVDTYECPKENQTEYIRAFAIKEWTILQIGVDQVVRSIIVLVIQ